MGKTCTHWDQLVPAHKIAGQQWLAILWVLGMNSCSHLTIVTLGENVGTAGDNTKHLPIGTQWLPNDKQTVELNSWIRWTQTCAWHDSNNPTVT